MTWKRCDGCTRAIANAAFTCEYCGHVCEDPLEYLTSEDGGQPSLVWPLDDDALAGNGSPHALPPLDLIDSFPASLMPSSDEAAAAPSPPEPMAPPAAAPAPPHMRRTIMAVSALAATLGLILTFLSIRGSASPSSAAATPVRPASTPAPARTTAAVPREPPVRKPAVVPHWRRMTAGRWVGERRSTVAFELEALEKIPVWTRSVTPLLVVRCEGGRVESFVFTQSAARMEAQDGDHTVRVAFDEGVEVTERWPDSDDHDALFASDGAAFVRRLSGSRTLRFGFEPHNAKPATAQFDISGLGELLAGSARQCGWKP